MTPTPTTLLVLAAGMGSRYGGLKQMDAVGPNGETIIDYSVYDAIKAGFSKVVFVIREDFAMEFKEKVSNKFTSSIVVDHVYQSLDTGIEHLPTPAERSKPWGTGHAILTAKNAVQEPFAAINADDFYGRDAFEQAHAFLSGLPSSDLSGMIGYTLEKTLSENGTVNRGICTIDEDYFLKDVVEHEKIKRTGEVITFDESDQTLPADAIVSMNFWLFHPDMFEALEEKFEVFLEDKLDVPKSEFYIPTFVDEEIKADMTQALVMISQDAWYGVTYQDDKASVQAAIAALHASGEYPSPLEY